MMLETELQNLIWLPDEKIQPRWKLQNPESSHPFYLCKPTAFNAFQEPRKTWKKLALLLPGTPTSPGHQSAPPGACWNFPSVQMPSHSWEHSTASSGMEKSNWPSRCQGHSRTWPRVHWRHSVISKGLEFNTHGIVTSGHLQGRWRKDPFIPAVK